MLEFHGDEITNFAVKKALDVQTKGEVRSLIIELFSGNPEIALLYFSGHGYFNEAGGYLVTPDCSTYDVGVYMDEVLNLANRSKAKNRIIILDCCYSGTFGNPSITENLTGIMDGITILTASREKETAKEMNGHGIFTNLLLEALSGGAADLSGNITPGSIYAFIDAALGPWDQRPVYKTNITSFTSLRNIPPPVPLTTLRKLTSYFPAADSEYKLNPSYEYTNTPGSGCITTEPYAIEGNAAIFKDLQKFASVHLVKPEGEEFMYFAAMNSKSCKLTPLGKNYWRLVKDGRI
jgi:hypothetical protein